MNKHLQKLRKIDSIYCTDKSYCTIYTNKPEGLEKAGSFLTKTRSTGQDSVGYICRIRPLKEGYLIVPYNKFAEPFILFPREISRITFTK